MLFLRAVLSFLVLPGTFAGLRVVLYEEPRLLKLFGEDWNRYAAAVPRWFALRPRVNRKT